MQNKKPRYEESDIKGLDNMGNTCYLNTAIQCLLFCPSFRQEVLNYTQLDQTLTPLCYQLRDVYYKLWIEKKSVTPKGLIYVIARSPIGKLIQVNYPNDLHEFLGLFTDALIEENKTVKNDNIIKPLFEKVLQGTQESSITCSHCGYSSVNKEIFSSLMLSFDAETSSPLKHPHIETEDKNKDKEKNQRTCPLELDDLLQSAFRDESIEGRTCDNCRQKRDETRKLRLRNPPQVLTLMIKRYDYSGRRINNMLDIPYDLNLSETYFSNLHKKDKTVKYKICSIACHFGSLHNGHYYSLVFYDNKWYMIDDETVNKIDTLPPSSDYYVLFYQKMN